MDFYIIYKPLVTHKKMNMILSTFHIISITLFIVAALVLVAMMILLRPTRMGMHKASTLK